MEDSGVRAWGVGEERRGEERGSPKASTMPSSLDEELEQQHNLEEL